MKFGIVLPSWWYSPQREALARAGFASLAKTRVPSSKPLLFLIWKDGSNDAQNYVENQLSDSGVFEGVWGIWGDAQGCHGTEMTLACGTERLFDAPQVTHCVWLGDDALFHPDWLIQLEALIGRHPDAKAWSVYHSAHQAYHKDLKEEPWPLVLKPRSLGISTLAADKMKGVDVLVRSICGHGMTFTREEWVAWGIDWRHGNDWANECQPGNTLDLHHACYRPGERWVTAKSYVQHTGVEGLHVTKGIPEYAIDFVGGG